MSDYEKATALHLEIEALYSRVEEHRAFLREPARVGPNVPLPAGRAVGMDCDRVLCSLAIKAATNKRAVFTLCQSGDGDSAMVLARVVIETWVLMDWLLQGPARDRLETFGLFLRAGAVRQREMIEKHFSDRPDFLRHAREGADPYDRVVAKSVFGGNDNSWAYFPVPGQPGKLRQVRIAEMFREVKGDFAYDVPYSEASDFVHSGPRSLISILAALVSRRYFTLEPMPSTTRLSWALTLSNGAMLGVINSLNSYCGLDLADALAGIVTTWTSAAKATFSEKINMTR